MKPWKKAPWIEAIRKQEFDKEFNIYVDNQVLCAMIDTEDKFKEFLIRVVVKKQFQEYARKSLHFTHSGGQVSAWLGSLLAYKDHFIWIWRGNPYHKYSETYRERDSTHRLSPEYAVFPSYPRDDFYVEVPSTEKVGLLNAFRMLERNGGIKNE